MSRDPRVTAQREILDAIAFYDSIGADWTDVVTFIGMRHAGILRDYLPCWCWRFRRMA